ncbi:MAG TPA: cupin domain-containing protein [Candidatus Binatia bacterium]
MAEKSVIAIEDVTTFALKPRRPDCEKGLLHDDVPVQTAMYRVQPGSGVPTHEHAQVYDLFIRIKGVLEIRYEGERGNGVFVLRPGAFCRVPPGVRHEPSNPSKTDETLFLLVQATRSEFDYVSVPFCTMEAALPFSPR